MSEQEKKTERKLRFQVFDFPQKGQQDFSQADRRWFLQKRWKPIKPLGSGAFGQVMECVDTKTNKQVAVKRALNVFQEWEDGLGQVRELKTMMHCKHSKIISLDDVLVPYLLTSRGVVMDTEFKDIYMVLPSKGNNIEKLIRTTVLAPQHITWIMFQLLDAIAYLHACEIMHRDIKPENILVDSKVNVTVIDFGLAREKTGGGNDDATEYVQTRWYRAPEVLINAGQYGYSVDVWSAGVVFLELLFGDAVFKGETEGQTLEIIQEILPDPDGYLGGEANNSLDLKQFFQDQHKSLDGYPPDILDLLQKLLTLNPANRITAEAALAHPAFNEWRQFRTRGPPPTPFRFVCPEMPSDIDEQTNVLRNIVWECMHHYNPSLPRTRYSD